jgi:hypothetical protein
LYDNKLTFKATALEDGNDATYRINIKATKVFDFGAPLFATDEQTLVVNLACVFRRKNIIRGNKKG